MFLKLIDMIYLRFDWRRRIWWASVCLVIFMGSSTDFDGKTKAGQENAAGNETKTNIPTENAVIKETARADKFRGYLFAIE